MSSYLVLNSWQGSDPEAVASRLAQMFRMEFKQASRILDELLTGGVWRMEKIVSDAQADVAEKYLRSLGFTVERSRADRPAAPAAPQAAAVTRQKAAGSGGPKRAVGFHGTGFELAKIMVINWVLTIFTLGIYYFWAKTRTRAYMFDQSSFAGDRFSYHGTGMELLKGWLIFMALVGSIAGLLAVAEGVWGPSVSMAIQPAITVILIALFPAIMVGAYRYRLSRSAWRGIRFSFRGTSKKAVGLYMKGQLLVLLTLGLYMPYFDMQAKSFWTGNTFFGNRGFEFKGEGRDIFKQFLLAVVLSLLTLGLYIIWYKAYVTRYTWSKTHFAGGTFRFTASGWQTFQLYLTNLLLLILTLGIAYPWVLVRNRRFVADHLTLEGKVNLDQVVQEIQKSGAVGEGVLDAFDIPLDIV